MWTHLPPAFASQMDDRVLMSCFPLSNHNFILIRHDAGALKKPARQCRLQSEKETSPVRDRHYKRIMFFSTSPVPPQHRSAAILQFDSSISQIVDCALYSTHARRAARRQTGSR